VVRDCWIALKLLEHWLPFNQKIIHHILHESFGQRRSLWSLFHMTSLMSSLCHDDFIMANDTVMETSHPPYSVKNFEKDWTVRVNAVPLNVFSGYFVWLLEMCKKWVAVKEIIVKRIKQFSSDFMCVAVGCGTSCKGTNIQIYSIKYYIIQKYYKSSLYIKNLFTG